MTDASSGEVIGFEKEIGKVQKALVDWTSGSRRNVAIVGDPYSGKTTFLREVSDRYGRTIKTVRLSKTVEGVDGVLPETGAENILAVDDCQFLYRRKIGGFEALEKFLDRVASSKELFITTWNRFSWNYLKQAFAMADYFPATIDIPAIDTQGIETVLRSKYDLDRAIISGGEKERKAFPSVSWKSLRIGGFHLSLPVVTAGRKAIGDTLDSDSSTRKRSIMEKLTDLSGGNPGVALAIWGRAYRDGTLDVGDMKVPDYDTDLDFDEAFVLSTILMTKRSTREDILEMAAGRLKTDKILYLLLNRGLIRCRDGTYDIDPLALYSVIKSLKKSRLVT